MTFRLETFQNLKLKEIIEYNHLLTILTTMEANLSHHGFEPALMKRTNPKILLYDHFLQADSVYRDFDARSQANIFGENSVQIPTNIIFYCILAFSAYQDWDSGKNTEYFNQIRFCK